MTRFVTLCRRSGEGDDATRASQAAFLAGLGGASSVYRDPDTGVSSDCMVLEAGGAAALRSRLETAPFAQAGLWSDIVIAAETDDAREATPVVPPASDVPPALALVPMPGDANPSGNVFGGWLLAQLDQAAGIAAWEFAAGRCVSMSVSTKFLAPARVGEIVRFYAKIVSAGRTSMRVGVAAWSSPREHRAMRCVADSEWLYVAVDADGNPRALERDRPDASAQLPER